MRKTILFVTPTFARTGSEIAIANLLCGADFKNYRILIYLYCNAGQLARQMPKELKVIVPLFSWFIPRSRIVELAIKRFISPLYLRYLILRYKPKLAYINTLTLANVLNILKSDRIPIIIHTHELEQMLTGLSPVQTRTLVEQPDFVIAASDRAAKVFRTLGRTEDMAVIPSPIDFESLQSFVATAQDRKYRREPFIWLMAGSLDSNKNPVRFVEIARKYLSKRKQDRFIWLGGHETGYALYAQALAKEYDLADHISWIQPKNHDDYLSRFAATNGVVITSDAESLSLVAIEAMAMGKPVVSFDNGGTGEILGRKYGVLVPKYDIDLCVTKMAAIATGRLKFRPDDLKKRAQDFDVSRVKDHWVQILERAIKS